jgi:hypothetical protein
LSRKKRHQERVEHRKKSNHCWEDMHMGPNQKIRRDLLSFSAALMVSILTFAQGLAAQSSSAQKTPEKISVTGHLDLQGMRVKQIITQQRGDKQYLFLRRADKNAFEIVDVTDPAHPALLDRSALSEPRGANVDLPGSGSAMAIAFVPERNSGSGTSPTSAVNLPTESIRLIDLSDPRHPKTIKTFEGVTSVATDDGRRLVFLVNTEGLWIVSHHRNHPLPVCTSESELESMPDCQ